MAGAPDDWADWAAWLDQHGAALVLLARQWLPSHADAEDVVQEAFIRFWRSRERAADPAAYLYACVKHCALDWQRGRKRQARREQAVARTEVESWFAGPLEEEERRETIAAALRELPQDQREVLVMKIWGGLSFPQIALALRISANTASSRYRYALAKLREQLAEESIP
jgi:RNA polymerase sigma-70 factor (ECF subfamily)